MFIYLFIFPVDDDSAEAVEARQEEAFAFHSQERIMGLLGAMIPPENKVSLWSHCT